MVALDLEQWMAAAGLSVAATARRAGLSATTLYRAMQGVSSPSLSTVGDIAAACGVEVVLRTRPLSTGAASEAARRMLEGDDDLPPASTEVERWMRRYADVGGSPAEVLQWAADASAPLHRAGAVHLRGRVTVGRLASAGDATGAGWAISAAPGLMLPARQDPCPSPALLWAADVRGAVQQLGGSLRSAEAGGGADVVVLHASSELLSNGFRHDGMTWASPLQILIDGLSMPGAVAELAREVLGSW